MSDLPPPFLGRLDAIILDNLHNDEFTIEKMCKELAISYSHTYRKIQATTGLSPSMYVCKKRLELACELMVETELTMGEIAHRVGFNTAAYFSKCFAAAYGCPPLRYRKKLIREQRFGVVVVR